MDCDPGQDDAVALLLAFAARDELDVLAITTVSGNVPLKLTQKNARIIMELAGATDTPVAAGCGRPLVYAATHANNVHGPTGLDGMKLFSPSFDLVDMHAVDLIITTLKAHNKGAVTLVCTGPLTNIAMFLRKAPELKSQINEIVLMGGAMREAGNITPSAEFNIYVDPHAADIVLQSGIPIVMHGLDVTHKVLCEPQRMEKIRALGTGVSAALYGMLTFFNRYDTQKYGTPGAPLHDPCTVAYLLKPELFKAKMCHVEISTSSGLTRGHTAVDYWRVTDHAPNVSWVYDVDADGFFDLLTDYLGRL
jgi:purine nucleosidase